MNILAFVYAFPPYQGGSGMGMYDLLKRLAKYKRYRIGVVTFNHGGASNIDVLDKMAIYRLSMWQVANIYPIPRPTIGNIILMAKALRSKPDVIYTRTRFFFTTLIGLMFSYILHKPMMHTEPGTCRVTSGRWWADIVAYIWDWTFGRLVAKRAKCVGVSNASAEYMGKLGAKKVKVIYNGVDKSIFNAVGVRRNNGSLRILYVGRFMWTKGFDILNEIADRIDGKGKIWVAGEGACEVNPKINNMGVLTPETLALKMKEADIFVLPSRMEGFSRVIQEAMVCGLPVVATDVGGNWELVSHGVTGLLTEVEAGSMAKAIFELTVDKSRRLRMGKSAVRVARKFDWDKTVREYRKILERMVK